jgi:peroxiredoxin Q/BCP
VAYFAASCDDPGTNVKFAQSLELDYPILSDPGKGVARAYGVVHGLRAVPERWTFYIGADGRIQYIDREVRAASHGEDVAARLQALRVPRRKSDS